MAIPSRETSTGHPVLNETRARQGRRGLHVFWVLVASTLLAFIGLFAAWIWRANDLGAAGADDRAPAAARTFDAPEPPPPMQPAS